MKYYTFHLAEKQTGESGELIGSDIDITNACKKCGAGAIYKSPFISKGLGKVSKDIFRTLDDHVIISARLYKILIDNGCKLDLLKVYDFRKKELPLYLFNSNFEFPKVYKAAFGYWDKKTKCECGKSGWASKSKIINEKLIIFPFNMSYKESDLDAVKMAQTDFFISWERFGVSRLYPEGLFGVKIGRPINIVSEKLKNLLQSHVDADMDFEKINIV